MPQQIQQAKEVQKVKNVVFRQRSCFCLFPRQILKILSSLRISETESKDYSLLLHYSFLSCCKQIECKSSAEMKTIFRLTCRFNNYIETLPSAKLHYS
jgi:hypothetical protein